jgi:Second Messenger Oligonucleotide or Dinucleotide Synthetase domain
MSLPPINNNPLQSLLALADVPLENFVRTIEIPTIDRQRSIRSFNYIKDVLINKANDGAISPLAYQPFQIGALIRGTKPAPLNDLDLFLPFNGAGTTYYNNGTLGYNNGNTVSSVAVLNQVKAALQETYDSDISRNQQAVTIYLSSYDMTLDIVPAVPIGTEYYVIPQGHGYHTWKKSNPDIDHSILTQLNTRHNWKVTDAIKIARHWNSTKNRNRLRSYHVEASAYHIFNNSQTNTTTLLTACSMIFDNLSDYIYNCPDPTGMSEPVHLAVDSSDFMLRLNLMASVNAARETLSRGSTAFVNYLNS